MRRSFTNCSPQASKVQAPFNFQIQSYLQKALFLIPFLTFTLQTWSQSSVMEEKLLEELPVDQEISHRGNSIFLNQIGEGNEARMIQQSIATGQNYIQAMQLGDYNEVFIHQTGMDNQSEVIQRGNENTYELNLDGNRNETAVLQDGDMNFVQQDLNGNGMEFTIMQEGNGNELIQEEKGQHDLKYQVYQKGEGISIMISHDQIK